MRTLTFLFLSVMLFVGCSPSRPSYSHNQPVPPQANKVDEDTVTSVSMFDAEDFDLETVVGLLTQELTPEQIQSFINDPQNAIHNVDAEPCVDQGDSRVCGDGNRDFIVVRQNRTENEVTLDFEAYASPPQNPAEESHTTVASVSARMENGQYNIQGYYPNYAHGYQNHHYSHSHGMSVGEGILLGMMFSSMMSPPYYDYGRYNSYQPVRVIERTRYIETRNSSASRARYRPSTPIVRSARPANFTVPATSNVTRSQDRVTQLATGSGSRNLRTSSSVQPSRMNSANRRNTTTAQPTSNQNRNVNTGNVDSSGRPTNATSAPRPTNRVNSSGSPSRSSWGSSSPSRSRSSWGGGGGSSFRSSSRRR